MSLLFKLVKKKYKKFRYHLLPKWLTPILWPDSVLNYPWKCRRFPELTKEFLNERRVREESNPRQKLSIDSYRQLIADEKSENMVRSVVDRYNKHLFKSKWCPTTVTIEDMDYILKNIESFNRIKRQLDYLFIKEFDKWRHQKVMAQVKIFKEEEKNKLNKQIKTIGCFDDQNQLQYGFWRNSLFSRYYESGVRKYSLNHLRVGTLFGQKMVIDCSFDKEMQEYEVQSVGRQMAKIYHMNRYITEPFDLHFCNCNHESRVMKNFLKYMRPIQESDLKYCLNIHTESYLKLFPDQRLIYLSPDAKITMEEYDHNAIYILGSLVGKTCRLPLTKWKAMDEGLECYKFPIHKYVKLRSLVKKTLSFQGCFKILLELKDHNDWEQAFKRGIQEHKLKDN